MHFLKNLCLKLLGNQPTGLATLSQVRLVHQCCILEIFAWPFATAVWLLHLVWLHSTVHWSNVTWVQQADSNGHTLETWKGKSLNKNIYFNYYVLLIHLSKNKQQHKKVACMYRVFQLKRTLLECKFLSDGSSCQHLQYTVGKPTV